MEFDLPPLYAVQRLADGTWLVRTLIGDPILPPVDVVAVVGAPTSAAPRGTFFNGCSITGALCPLLGPNMLQNSIALGDRVGR